MKQSPIILVLVLNVASKVSLCCLHDEGVIFPGLEWRVHVGTRLVLALKFYKEALTYLNIRTTLDTAGTRRVFNYLQSDAL